MPAFHPLRTFRRREIGCSVKNEDDDLSSFRYGHWRVQPKWVKALTVGIALPAWLVLMTDVFTGNTDSRLNTAAFIAFATVAILQMIFVFRAYWRMDL